MKAMPLATQRTVVVPWEEKLPIEEQTRFIVDDLSVEERVYIDDHSGIQTRDGVVPQTGTRRKLALDFGLVRVENLTDAGSPIELVRDEDSPYIGHTRKRPWKAASLARVPLTAQTWLALYLLGENVAGIMKLLGVEDDKAEAAEKKENARAKNS